MDRRNPCWLFMGSDWLNLQCYKCSGEGNKYYYFFSFDSNLLSTRCVLLKIGAQKIRTKSFQKTISLWYLDNCGRYFQTENAHDFRKLMKFSRLKKGWLRPGSPFFICTFNGFSIHFIKIVSPGGLTITGQISLFSVSIYIYKKSASSSPLLRYITEIWIPGI